ncbi:MAG: glycosyltransferase family 87 protein [Anaerolineaceae bacterium]
MKRPFSNLSSRELENLFNVGLAFALILYILDFLFILLKNANLNDFPHFWRGSRTLLDGGDPYKLVHYHPLPWVLLFSVPIALVPLQEAIVVIDVVNIFVLIFVLIILNKLKINGLPLWHRALLGILCVFNAIPCLITGQLGLWMVLGLAVSLLSLKRGKDLLVGISSVLLLLKPWLVWIPGLALALLVIYKRRWKAVIGFICASAVLIFVTWIIFPNCFSSFLHVNFQEALGGGIEGNLVYFWPLATPADFFTFVLNIKLTSIGRISLWSVWIFLGVFMATWALVLWKHEKLKDEALVGVAALLGLFLSPYVRHYDYILLIIWIAAFSGLEWKCLPRWGRMGLVVSMVLSLAVFIGSHPEPWVILSLFMLYCGTLFALISLTFGNRVVDNSING